MAKRKPISFRVVFSLVFLSILFQLSIFDGGIFSKSALAEEDETQAPKIKITEPVFDFGTVTQGSKVEHSFNLVNEGNADLQIQRVIPSCGCTASTASKDVLAPGEEGMIETSFDTTGFSGSKTKTVRVYTNDIDNPIIMLSLKGEIEPDVIVEPKRVFFGEVIKGLNPGGLQQEITIKVKENSEVNLGDIKVYSKNVEIKELKSSNKEKKLLVSLKPDAPVGELRERAVVSLTGARRQSVNIPIFASVKGNLRVDPRTLSFGIIEGDEMIKRSVKLENLGSEKIELTGIESSEDSVGVKYKELKKGKIYQIDVSIDPKTLTKDLRASVKVSTNSKENETVSFNVYGILPPKG
ncbi:MAG: DUF1573 domain-containing protein [Bdellovibrionales bacterium]|nr:DUF1573 domain-containing protein [Bdellovibrionales bacterium]